LAKGVSLDKGTGEKGGELQGWVSRGMTGVPGVTLTADDVGRVLAAEAGTVLADPIRDARGYHVIKVLTRESERQRPFDEVSNEVYRALRAQKETEVQQRVLASLRDDYDVVIHLSRFPAAAAPEAVSPAAPPAQAPPAAVGAAAP
jgi:hypothetical protein